ncbi:MAG: serine hydrolase [Aphanizomenon flos-aquae Clear-A1]|jgi:beta-lactamase class A|uniref:Serine hydrolase n=1 Tax=Aphanizomenon flos-aquae LD13 TaxID=1710894 RepID=A0A1B7W0M7_APHFL|nr:serine hydrolase [Aphanizomenon flos-aquae Clear-A1]MBO1043602.1 serine hydrolase [Aphanizomenon flos-aquae UKL13-PB]MBO1062685.1 serine hydrolase [Aphanizomenon flos-aquae CP01]NTW20756.1 serine hydrolase [Nostocales cyanobacterium W4_Combined_metabat2_030]OBQ26812.1 MAG: serine hydrolase [Aphanizomenon flos-aquae LD13]OBQ28066.1 MAG: serine hydrolase [Aphanizomenon flos-aquae MDT14a]HCQ20825.1 serine hydrolase [Anabaena sp. UBA12330]
MVFFNQDQQLENIANQILEATWTQFSTLAINQIALTWVVYDHPAPVNTGGALTPNAFWEHPVRGFSYRGAERIYPASVVKLFYLVVVQEWLEKAMIQPSKELDRALTDMIVDSSNDATSLIVDILSGTTSGPQLTPGPFETWKYQRNIINRYYQSLGWEEMQAINLCQKTWGDGPYGRERAFYGEMFENRNMLTTDATARLLHSIIGGVAVSSGRSQSMMNLLKRSPQLEELPQNSDENQVTGFLGGGLPKNSQIWSKAGWTSTVRHDAAYIELPDQRPYLLVVFTEGKEQATNREILPFVSGKIAEAVSNL